ncbi:MAG: threonine/serine dehydratase [Deltaproteobacteria bacterium]|jgi:threonine dehydratase|nr:threonine/serine dehydratase [Deltaproteobacteria bacterium]
MPDFKQEAEDFRLPYADIVSAARRLLPYAVRTPLLENPALNERLGARVLIKSEAFQRTGSFKFRGACNRALQLGPEHKKSGVVAWSSGNHAQGLAAACAMLGMPATIVMPADAPLAKINGAKAYGATVRLYDRKSEDREALGREIAAQSGAAIVPPYDDAQVMAGQGTVGLEIMEQAQALGLVPDCVLAGSSGGGLIAGIATAVKETAPDAAVYAVEPEEFDELARSLRSGRRESNRQDAHSICDALQAATPGRLTFAVNKRLLAGSLTVSDAEVLRAMRTAFEMLKLVVEPGGACPLAALLSGRLDIAGKTVAVVCSGGNVDPDMFMRALQTA